MPDIRNDERGWQGRELIDRDGESVGLIQSVDLDDAGKPTWARVETGASGVAIGVVPLAAATIDGPAVRVPYDRALILAAPTVHGPLSSNEEALLAEHYGLDKPVTMAPDEPSEGYAGSGEGRDDHPHWESAGDASDSDDRDWHDRPQRDSAGEATGSSGGDIGDF